VIGGVGGKEKKHRGPRKKIEARRLRKRKKEEKKNGKI